MASTRTTRTPNSSRAMVRSGAASKTIHTTSSSKRGARGVDEVDELARNVRSVLKVSEPLPQTSRKAANVSAAARSKIADGASKAGPSAVKPAVPSRSKVPAKSTTISTRAETAPRPGASSSLTALKTPSTNATGVGATTQLAKPAVTRAISGTATAAAAASRTKPAVRAPTAGTATASASLVGAQKPPPSSRPPTTTANHPTTSARLTHATASASAKPASTTLKTAATKNATTSTSHATFPPIERRPLPKVPKPEWAASDAASVEQAKSAMAWVNKHLKLLSEAANAGYRYGSTETVPVGDKTTSKEEVESWVANSLLATSELRRVDAKGVLGKKSIECDKAGMAMVVRLLVMRMNQWALDELVLIRASLLKRYTHASSTSSSDAMSMSTARIPGVPKEWMELMSVPAPDGDVDDTLRSLLFESIASAWTGFLGLKIRTDVLGSLYPLPDCQPPNMLHPLVIARTFQLQSTSSLLSTIHRHLSSLSPKDHSERLFTQQLGLAAAVLTVSAASPGKTTPASLWGHLHRTAKSVITASSDPIQHLPRISETIRWILKWTQAHIEAKGERREQWCSGTEWTELLDFWIDIARKMRDKATIQHAVNLMTNGNVPLMPSTPPSRTSTISIPVSQPRTPGRSKGKLQAKDTSAGVLRLCGNLAETNVVLESYLANTTDELQLAAAQSALRDVTFGGIPDLLVGLDESADTPALLGKVSRGIERIRRRCSKLVSDADTPAALKADAAHWIGCAVDLVEDVIGCPVDFSTVAMELTSGAIESIGALARNASTPQSAHTILQRARRLVILTKSTTTESRRAEWLRWTSCIAHNIVIDYYKQEKYSDALPLAKYACEVGTNALQMVTEESKQKPIWTALEQTIARRYEILASCYFKMGERLAAVEGYFNCLALSPASAVEMMDSSSRTKPLAKTTEPVALTLTRLVPTMLTDIEPIRQDINRLLAILDPLPKGVTCAIVERVIEMLLELSHKPEVAQISLDLSDWLLKTYMVELMPIRRLRVLAQMIGCILRSGVASDRFDQLVEEATVASSADVAENSALERFRTEYTAGIYIQRALHAYYTPQQDVLSPGRKGMRMLREALIPALPVSTPKPKKRLVGRSTSATVTPKSRGTRSGSRAVSDGFTPAKTPLTTGQDEESVFEDPSRLTSLLSALIALFGVLGHVLAKIEALKVSRAMLRNQPIQINDYLVNSGLLATEYLKLGKHTKAKAVFVQCFKALADTDEVVNPHPRIALHLRHAVSLAISVPPKLEQAREAYVQAEQLERDLIPTPLSGPIAKVVDRVEALERAALANIAQFAIASQQNKVALATAKLFSAFNLYSRVSDVACRIAPEVESAEKPVEEDPFLAKPKGNGADEPSKDAVTAHSTHGALFSKKHLSGLQWSAAEDLVSMGLLYSGALANRGSVRDAEYYLKTAREVAEVLRSPTLMARVDTRSAELHARQRKYETSLEKLTEASKAFLPALSRSSSNDGDEPMPITPTGTDVGPDVFEIKRVRGDVFAKREMVAEAGEMFDAALVSVQGIEQVFNETEALLPTPRKLRESVNALAVSAGRAATAIRPKAGQVASHESDDRMEVVLMEQLKKVWRQQAWLLRESGFPEDSEDILQRIKTLTFGQVEVEDLWLDGKIGLIEAFDHFKSDLWMSSLTESSAFDPRNPLKEALAMPMGDPQQRTKDRRETRKSIQSILQRSERSYIDALQIASSAGRVEDVRMACLNLALLRAFQTSLGEGSVGVTASAADILASAPAITLQRELLEAIDLKYKVSDHDEIKWVNSGSLPCAQDSPSRKPLDMRDGAKAILSDDAHDDDDAADKMRPYWESRRAKYTSNTLLEAQDLSSLPPDWVIISINVTDDRNTMFISRHQVNHDPLVFTLPLDRQGKREGEAEGDILTFDMMIKQFDDIIQESVANSRSSKSCTTPEAIAGWWNTRIDLDRRLKEFVATVEFCWLGAFKAGVSGSAMLIEDYIESKLERIFNGALNAGSDLRKTVKVHLDDMLLRTFATLSGKCKDEEVEDLVYFILDIYQFYGAQVALAELDIDQIGIDVKTALTEIEAMREAHRKTTPPKSEHMFLALDKNVSSLPWESIPILRGRAVSRVPSLPFLLDQVEMMNHLPPLPGAVGQRKIPAKFDGKRKINTNRVFYILNPSGDLERTQMFFESYVKGLEAKGWKGIIGRSPTELEMIDALTNYDLVLYFGHGGAEQYIRSSRLKLLKKCATVMLWGCSSGALRDHGDFDRSGTAWNYVLGGCPSLTANLWDVTDKDIDRLSEAVFKNLRLDNAHVPALPNKFVGEDPLVAGISGISLGEMSLVEAIAKSREETRLKYLTGAAPVVYGLPMYLH